MLSAKSISDVKPTAQRMPPTNTIMRNLTSSTVLLPGSVLMQQRNEGDQGKYHWNLSKSRQRAWNGFISESQQLSSDISMVRYFLKVPWKLHRRPRGRLCLSACSAEDLSVHLTAKYIFPTPIVSILCSFFFLNQAWPSILHSYHTATLKLWCNRTQMRSK